MKIRAAGGAMEMAAKAIDPVSARIPGPEVLPSLQRGTLGGGFLPLRSIGPFALQDVLTSLTSNAGVGSFTLIHRIRERSWLTRRRGSPSHPPGGGDRARMIWRAILRDSGGDGDRAGLGGGPVGSGDALPDGRRGGDAPCDQRAAGLGP